jgi:hypothetical protein
VRRASTQRAWPELSGRRAAGSVRRLGTQRCKRPLMLEPEPALDGGAATVQGIEAGRLARDQPVQPVGLDSAGAGLALAGRAAPLGRLATVVRSGDRPRAVLTSAACRLRASRPESGEGDDRAGSCGPRSLIDPWRGRSPYPSHSRRRTRARAPCRSAAARNAIRSRAVRTFNVSGKSVAVQTAMSSS